MMDFGGWKLPDGEAHLPGWMKKVNDWRADTRNADRRLLYQGAKYRRAMALCPATRRRAALDIGGHVGLWAWQMAMDFRRVWAFEPMPEHRECFEVNLRHFKNWTLFPFALGATPSMAHIRTRTKGSSGDTGIDLAGNGTPVAMKALDEFNLSEIDFMKIDCEGFEFFVLQGGEETIRRNKPVIIVEQKPETGMEANYKIGTKDAVKFLQILGAKQAFEIAGDHIMTW